VVTAVSGCPIAGYYEVALGSAVGWVKASQITQASEFKICSTESSDDANLGGTTFPYDYSYKANSLSASGSLSLMLNQPTVSGPVPQTCSTPLSLPTTDKNGQPVVITVTALTPTGAPYSSTFISLYGFQYLGAGEVVSSPDFTMGPAVIPATVKVSIGSGLNLFTFTNGPTRGAGPTRPIHGGGSPT